MLLCVENVLHCCLHFLDLLFVELLLGSQPGQKQRVELVLASDLVGQHAGDFELVPQRRHAHRVCFPVADDVEHVSRRQLAALPQARLVPLAPALAARDIVLAAGLLAYSSVPSLELCQSLEFCKPISIIFVASQSLQCLAVDLEVPSDLRG